jgi:hypothetical protein
VVVVGAVPSGNQKLVGLGGLYGARAWRACSGPHAHWQASFHNLTRYHCLFVAGSSIGLLHIENERLANNCDKLVELFVDTYSLTSLMFDADVLIDVILCMRS